MLEEYVQTGTDESPLNIMNIYSVDTPPKDIIQGALIFNTPLTASEHVELYGQLMNMKWPAATNSKAKVSTIANLSDSALMASYDMTPINNTLIDQSGKGKTGTLTGKCVHNKSLIGNSIKLDDTTGYISSGNIGSI